MNTDYTEYTEAEQMTLFEVADAGQTETSTVTPYSSKDCVGSIGEKLFEIECLRNGINILQGVTSNARVDRWIEKNGRVFSVHIKSSCSPDKGGKIRFRLQGVTILYNDPKKFEPRPAVQADYFVCVWAKRGEETMWWLPYEKYRNIQSLGIDDRFNSYRSIPKELQ
jgi:hypothetical protein